MKKEISTRIAAFKTLTAIFSGQRLDFAMEKIPSMDGQDTAFTKMIIMTVIRRNGELESVIKKLVPKKIKKIEVEIILKIGLAQLMFMDTAEHGAINTTVEMAKFLKFQPFASLINAVLRNWQRKKSEIKTSPTDNIPKWLQSRIQKDFNTSKLQSIAASILNPPSLFLTVKNNPQKWAEKLNGEVIRNNTIKIPSQKITDIEGFVDGEWWVQDFSAAIPVQLFNDDLKNKDVADFCSAPGGKTAQIMLLGGNATAFDISEKRTKIMKDNFNRLGMNANIIIADANEYLEKNPKEFDYILLDAPCSAVGTIRRNPDILLKQEPSIPVKEQEKLLEAAFSNLKSGGKIVYSVCSFFKQEGEDQVNKFLSRHKNAVKIDVDIEKEISENGFMLITPDYMHEKGGVDGFFAAVIKKI